MVVVVMIMVVVVGGRIGGSVRGVAGSPAPGVGFKIATGRRVVALIMLSVCFVWWGLLVGNTKTNGRQNT